MSDEAPKKRRRTFEWPEPPKEVQAMMFEEAEYHELSEKEVQDDDVKERLKQLERLKSARLRASKNYRQRKLDRGYKDMKFMVPESLMDELKSYVREKISEWEKENGFDD